MDHFKTAVILGGQPLNAGIVERYHEHGFRVIVVDFREKLALPYDQHILADAKSPDAGKILRGNNILQVDTVYTSMDNAGLAQRSVCLEYGLLCPDSSALIAAHDKKIMHEQWREAGLLNRISEAYQEYPVSRMKVLNDQFDLIIKPADACASRGITVVTRGSSEAELRTAFIRAKENSDNSFVNIEEFVSGTEFTVEMLGDQFGNVAVYGVSRKYHTKNTDRNKIAVKLHYNASDVSDELMQKLAEYGIRCYRALGLKNSMGHLEILLKEDGSFSPIEMGARSSGFIASHLVDIVSGKSFLMALHDVQHGARIESGLIKQTEMSSMYFFYDIPQDSRAVRTLSILPFLRPFARTHFHLREKLKAGEFFPKINADTDRWGLEVLSGRRSEMTIEAVSAAEQQFLSEFLGKNEEQIDCSIPIFDSITHPTINGNWLNVRFNGLAHVDDLLSEMRRWNIAGAFAVGMSGVGAYSPEDYISHLHSAGNLYPVAFWNFNDPLPEMDRLKQLGFRGIKIHPRLSEISCDDPRIPEVIRYANRLGLIVLFCSFSGITPFFASAVRSLRFVLLHSGFEHLKEAIALILPLDGVLLDLSYTICHNLSDREFIRELLRKYPRRFCVGSDHPEVSYRTLRICLNELLKEFPSPDVNAICHDNLNSFFHEVTHP